MKSMIKLLFLFFINCSHVFPNDFSSNQNFQDVVLLLGYNNTRINDVRKIKALAYTHLNAKTVLCKKSPTQQDAEAVDYVIDTSLNAESSAVDTVLLECQKLHLKVIAVLPFSDQGTQLGALLAERLDLPGANSNKVRSALDKNAFRLAENEVKSKPEGYCCIFSKKISSKKELRDEIVNHPLGLFLKPCQEGNNRGCIAVHSVDECDRAWAFVEKYISGGLLIEELVTNAHEYSCDSSGLTSWITDKEICISSCGKFRGEIQAIVPAPLNDLETQRVLESGRFMATLCGSNGSAYHNEVFLKGNEIMAVEVNLRPAGARIWDSAKYAFEGFDPWLEWLQVMSGKESELFYLNRNNYIGFRLMIAPKEGKITSFPDIELNDKMFELVWTKKIGDSVVTDIRDNADFVGYILVKDKDYKVVDRLLKEWTQNISAQIAIE